MTRQELESKGMSKDEQIDFLLTKIDKLENNVRDLQNQVLAPPSKMQHEQSKQ